MKVGWGGAGNHACACGRRAGIMRGSGGGLRTKWKLDGVSGSLTQGVEGELLNSCGSLETQGTTALPSTRAVPTELGRFPIKAIPLAEKLDKKTNEVSVLAGNLEGPFLWRRSSAKVRRPGRLWADRRREGFHSLCVHQITCCTP